MEGVHQLEEALVSCPLDPGREVPQRLRQSRPCRPTLEPILAHAVRPPAQRNAQEGKAVLDVFLGSTET
jgi:hypothetical protein